MPALVQVDVIVTEFDREDRLLRAEGGREEERLSERRHTEVRKHYKITPQQIFLKDRGTPANITDTFKNERTVKLTL